MPDNTIELPNHTVELIDETGADGPLFLATANSAHNLEQRVIDIRKEAPDAFPPRTVPERVVTDKDSFAAELERRKLIEGVSTVWGNRQRGEFTAVYDELDPSAVRDYTRRHDRLVLRFIKDPDWDTLFKAADGEYHSQEKFADLIESAGHLITSHPAADLVELVNNIRGSSKGSFESRINRSTGSLNLTYSEEVTVRGKSTTSSGELEVPKDITFAARPFEDYPLVTVKCWLRLLISGGQMRMGLFPQPYEHLVRDAWNVVTGQVAEQIGAKVYAANIGR
ncbi:DUF2303 family protein [Mycolicibacterium llatzerense]|uniref:DUF2303 domain-containing protein n=1 Tax=Mycolicibacterium llatzerense TaxID=280871 RepID=A0A0D1LAR1_9MYCO|nr:DUF2303 family protein [Mycolicibacterium llatzerense]KIU17885.1 hypothetical protein TL10_06410 [Mycolicibacterium llatzerense]